MAIRTLESIEALTTCLITFASCSPTFDNPRDLRLYRRAARAAHPPQRR
jgi:hypothetical protein